MKNKPRYIDDNYAYCQEAIGHKDAIDGQFWDLAGMLYRIKGEELFSGGWTSWEEYCSEFRGMSRRGIDKMIQLHRVLVVGFGFQREELQKAGGWALLAEALPYMKTREEAAEWILKSGVLTLQDIRKELRERRTGIPMSTCSHPNSYVVRVCPDCGDTEKIYQPTP